MSVQSSVHHTGSQWRSRITLCPRSLSTDVCCLFSNMFPQSCCLNSPQRQCTSAVQWCSKSKRAGQCLIEVCELQRCVQGFNEIDTTYKVKGWDWRVGSVDKSTLLFQRPRFNSQHPYGSSQVAVTPVPENQTSSHRHTYRQNTNAHQII